MDARTSYREAAARGARPVQLVVLLYEQCVADLRRAVVALERNDVEARTREINHAIMVIGHLQASLDMEHGGQVARNLSHFYNTVRNGLVEAHTRQSVKALEEQISHLMLVREAWAEVERPNAAPAASNLRPSPAPDHSHRPSEWDA